MRGRVFSGSRYVSMLVADEDVCPGTRCKERLDNTYGWYAQDNAGAIGALDQPASGRHRRMLSSVTSHRAAWLAGSPDALHRWYLAVGVRASTAELQIGATVPLGGFSTKSLSAPRHSTRDCRARSPDHLYCIHHLGRLER